MGLVCFFSWGKGGKGGSGWVGGGDETWIKWNKITYPLPDSPRRKGKGETGADGRDGVFEAGLGVYLMEGEGERGVWDALQWRDDGGPESLRDVVVIVVGGCGWWRRSWVGCDQGGEENSNEG